MQNSLRNYGAEFCPTNSFLIKGKQRGIEGNNFPINFNGFNANVYSYEASPSDYMGVVTAVLPGLMTSGVLISFS